MKLSEKITIVFTIFLFIPLVIFMTIYFVRIYDVVREGYITIKNDEVDLRVSQIEGMVQTIKNEVVILANLASVSGYIESANTSEKAQYRKQIIDDFTSFSQVNTWYYQIRYIDESGQEIVRVDTVEGVSYAISPDNLQNKADRYDFKKTVENPRGTIYISPVDLNVENGSIENRGTTENPLYVPVIRFAVPVFDTDGVSRGILITNVYAQDILDTLKSSDPDAKYYLINADGYYLSHPQKEMTFGFMFDESSKRFSEEFPEIAAGLSSFAQEETTLNTDNNQFVAVQRMNVFLDQEDPLSLDIPEQIWTLIKFSSTQGFRSQVLDIALRLVSYSLGIALLSIAAGYLFIRQNLEPLKKLDEATAIVAQGNLDHTVEIKTGDEIESLAHNFNKMIEQLKKTLDSVEKKIKERTERLTKLNHILIGREMKMKELKEKIHELEQKNE